MLDFFISKGKLFDVISYYGDQYIGHQYIVVIISRISKISLNVR